MCNKALRLKRVDGKNETINKNLKTLVRGYCEKRNKNKLHKLVSTKHIIIFL